MPGLGQTSDQLTLISWYRREGDHVDEGDVLFECESDKTTVEVESVAAGTVLRLLCDPGETVTSGSVIAWIGAPGDEIPGEDAPFSADESGVEAAHPRGTIGAVGETSRTLATPAARALAREHGVDLQTISGSGPGGRIERRDVRSAAEPAGSDTLLSPRDRPVKHRLVIAERLERAAAVPQFSLERAADVRTALERRAEHPGLSLTHLLLQAVAAALRACPRVNQLWRAPGPYIEQVPRCDVGLAIAGDDSLVVATIPEPDQLPLDELISVVREATIAGRAGRLPASLTSPTAATVSNLGMFGVDRFRAIVDPDQTCILAVGQIVYRPVVANGEVIPIPQVDLTLSVDHRAVDGVHAARFLAAVCAHLEGGDAEHMG